MVKYATVLEMYQNSKQLVNKLLKLAIIQQTNQINFIWFQQNFENPSQCICVCGLQMHVLLIGITAFVSLTNNHFKYIKYAIGLWTWMILEVLITFTSSDISFSLWKLFRFKASINSFWLHLKKNLCTEVSSFEFISDYVINFVYVQHQSHWPSSKTHVNYKCINKFSVISSIKIKKAVFIFLNVFLSNKFVRIDIW